MKRFTISAIAVAVGLTFSAGAMARSMSKQDYKTGIERIESEYKADKNNCQSLSGNANDICEAEAKAKEKVAKAELTVVNKNTKQARYDARIARAEADYSVAKEKCDDLAGNANDVCLKEAKAAEVTAKSNAKSQMKTSKAYNEANKKSAEASNEAKDTSAEARRDANVDKRDAEYAVSKEKCDALSGNAKENCVNEAKMHFGKM